MNRVILLVRLEVNPWIADEPLRDIERRSLVPLFALMDFSENLRLSLSLPARTLHGMGSELAHQMAQLVERGQLEVLPQLYGEPFPALLDESTARECVEAAAEEFSRRTLPKSSFMWLPDGLSPLLAEPLAACGMRGVIVPSACIADGATGLVLAECGARSQPFAVLSVPPPVAVDALKLPPDPVSASAGKLSFVHILFSEHHLMPNGGAVTMRHHLADLLQPFRTSRGMPPMFAAELLDPSHTAQFLSAAGVQPASTLFAPAATVPDLPPCPAVASRILQLRSTLAALPGRIATAPNEVANRDRLAIAQLAVREAAHRALFVSPGPQASSARLFASGRLIRAQVEVDAIQRPDTDPFVGWIETHGADVDQPVVIETQLACITLDRQSAGSLASFEYKPRKHDFAAAWDQTDCALSGIDVVISEDPVRLEPEKFFNGLQPALAQAAATPADVSVTRSTKDLVAVRVLSPCIGATAAKPSQIFKQYLFKAGIGAHLNNATTGWSLEYWIEGPTSAQQSLVTHFSLIMPSADARTNSIRALTAAGGAAESASGVAPAHRFAADNTPGGCYGIRLIDGITGLLIELRSAKQLTAVFTKSMVDESTKSWNGVAVAFVVSASRIADDAHANTIFVSVK